MTILPRSAAKASEQRLTAEILARDDVKTELLQRLTVMMELSGL